jgi:hypothetical protein
MTSTQRGSTVVICEPDEGPGLRARVGADQDRPALILPFGDLPGGADPRHIRVLALHSRGQPPGLVLALVARWAVEFPWMQRVAVFDVPPSLPVATQLARSGFWLIQSDRDRGAADSLNRALETLTLTLPWIDAPATDHGVQSQRSIS